MGLDVRVIFTTLPAGGAARVHQVASGTGGVCGSVRNPITGRVFVADVITARSTTIAVPIYLLRRKLLASVLSHSIALELPVRLASFNPASPTVQGVMPLSVLPNVHAKLPAASSASARVYWKGCIGSMPGDLLLPLLLLGHLWSCLHGRSGLGGDSLAASSGATGAVISGPSGSAAWAVAGSPLLPAPSVSAGS